MKKTSITLLLLLAINFSFVAAEGDENITEASSEEVKESETATVATTGDEKLADATPAEEKIQEEKLIAVLVASYNNRRWHDQHLTTIFNQTHENKIVIYIDDASTDGTADMVERWAHTHNVRDRLILVRNKERIGAMANHYYAVNLLPDGVLVGVVDGDDWFYTPSSLSHINKLFTQEDIWMSYGQFVTYPGYAKGWGTEIPKRYVNNNAFRDFPHNLTHMRVFYAGLFKAVKKEDFMYQGEFLKMCNDNAAQFPMAEMARGHMKFNSEVVYVWNGANPINDHKVSKQLQRSLDLMIRRKPRYDKLETPFRDGQPVTIDQIKENFAEAEKEGFKV